MCGFKPRSVERAVTVMAVTGNMLGEVLVKTPWRMQAGAAAEKAKCDHKPLNVILPLSKPWEPLFPPFQE